MLIFVHVCDYVSVLVCVFVCVCCVYVLWCVRVVRDDAISCVMSSVV